jgi:purine-cytosine permease-like protein
MTAFMITAGFQLGWAPYVSDYSRYLPSSTSSRQLFWWTYAPSAALAIWVFVIGALAQVGSPGVSPIAAFRRAGDALYPGVGLVIIVGLLVTLLTVMAINQYGGSLTILSIIDSVRPIKSTRAKRMGSIVFMALVVWALAHTVGEERFNQFYGGALIYLAYIFTPWTAINLADYFIVRRGNYVVADLVTPSGGIYGRWNWRGNIVYIVTLGSMIPFMVTPQFTGALARRLGDVDLCLPVGLIAGTGLYLLACRYQLPSPVDDATDREAQTGAAASA